MKARYKKFSEFMSAIKVVHRPGGGVKIVCSLKGKEYVVLESRFKPWNSETTRKGFLSKLYIKEVLERHNMAKGVPRIPGYELLGKRCMYNDILCVVCNSYEAVNQDTGEMTTIIVVSPAGRFQKTYKLEISKVQI